MTTKTEYKDLLVSLQKALAKLKPDIQDTLNNERNIDQIKGRVKSANSFMKKASEKDERGLPKYPDPIQDIFDLIGFRVVVRYNGDLNRIRKRIRHVYPEIRDVKKKPEKGRFSFQYIRLVCAIPAKIIDDCRLPIKYFEIQICTLFQHAWAEAEHDIGYKAYLPIPEKKKRYMDWMAAQVWGADQIFEKLRKGRNG